MYPERKSFLIFFVECASFFNFQGLPVVFIVFRFSLVIVYLTACCSR